MTPFLLLLLSLPSGFIAASGGVYLLSIPRSICAHVGIVANSAETISVIQSSWYEVFTGQGMSPGTMRLGKILSSYRLTPKHVLSTSDGPAMLRITAPPWTVVAHVMIEFHLFGDRTDFAEISSSCCRLHAAPKVHLSITGIGFGADPNMTARPIFKPSWRVFPFGIPRNEYAHHNSNDSPYLGVVLGGHAR